jgi:pilus assembly protein CpaC
LVVMVTPYLVDAQSCDQVAKLLPGQETRSPDDFELFLEGILEAPRGPRPVFHGNRYVPAYRNGPTAELFPCAGKHGRGHGDGKGPGACGNGACANGGNGNNGNGGCAPPPVKLPPVMPSAPVTPAAGAQADGKVELAPAPAGPPEGAAAEAPAAEGSKPAGPALRPGQAKDGGKP